MRMRHSGKLAHRLDHTRLVVGEHDGDEGDIRIHHRLECIGLDIARATRLDHVNCKARGAQQRQIIQDGVVLDGRHNHARAVAICLASSLGKTEQSKHVRLGAATGKDNLVGAHASTEGACNGSTALLKPNGSATAQRMQGVRIHTRKLGSIVDGLSLNRLRAHGRGGGVI